MVYAVKTDWSIVSHKRDLGEVMRAVECRYIGGSESDCKIFIERYKPKFTDDEIKKECCKFLEWAMTEEWQPYDGVDRWICQQRHNIVLETKDLYDEYKKNNP